MNHIVKRGLLSLGMIVLGAGAAWSAADEAKPWYGELEYRQLGPAIGGRVARVAGVPGDPLTWYIATAQGGVWKSEDGGVDWKPIFDEQPTNSIGAIAVAPSDPNVIYVGGGEANIRGNVANGDGIYRSTDAGKTWTHVWQQKGQIGTLAVHPGNPDVAYAAVLGHAFGPNPERGVYRTEDGGVRWKRVLEVDEVTGASDVALDPSNPRIVFAGTWQTVRRPWTMTSGGPGGGLWRSSDGGDHWVRLQGQGLPEGIWGKVGVRVAPSDGSRVYALIEASEGGLFRSDDGGSTWKRVNGHNALRQRAWYYTVLTVDPANPDIVWFPQVHMLRTIDGGATIHSVPGFGHGDHHDLWIDPVDPRRMIAGNDGGVDLSGDGGKSWRAPHLPLAQFYNLDVDDRVPYHVGGTIQDQGTASAPSHSLRHGGHALSEWRAVGGGEAGDFVFGEGEPGQIYAGEYSGYLSHFDEATGRTRSISIYPTNASGHGAEDLRHRFQWTAPLATSPHDPKVLYHGAEVLFRTTDRGATWTAISPDLTRNDRDKMRWSGGPITGDNTGVEIYGTIFSVAESPLAPGAIWAGTDDGLVQLTRDGGVTWQNVTPAALPAWATVECIEPSRFEAGTAYVVVDAHRLDDDRPYLFRTRDWGASWESLAAGLPQGDYLMAVREDPERRGLLFLGHARGIAFSRDEGKSWEQLKLNLPPVTVVDLEIHDGDLVVATRGRSIWVLDDLGALRGFGDASRDAPLFLLPPRPAIRWSLDWGWGQRLEGAGENPPYGATVDYWLKEPAEGEVVLEVIDASGKVRRRLSSEAETARFAKDDPDEPTPEPKAALSAEAGLHRVVWDLRFEGAPAPKGSKLDTGDPPVGPVAPPGAYRLRLSAGDRSVEAPLEVEADPRVDPRTTDYAAQLELADRVLGAISRIVDRVEEIRSIRSQVADLVGRLVAAGEEEAVVASGRAVLTELRAIELELHNPDAEVVYDILARPGGAKTLSVLTWLYGTGLDENGDPPTQGQREVFDEELAKLDGLETRFAALKSGELANLERLARAADLPRVLPPPPSR